MPRDPCAVEWRGWCRGGHDGIRSRPVLDGQRQRTILLCADPSVQPVDRFGQLSLELPALIAKRRCDCRAECDQSGDERDDDQWSAGAPWNPPSLKAIDAGRYRKSEQDAEKRGEEERVDEPEELRGEVESHRQSRGPHDVPALPANASLAAVRDRGGDTRPFGKAPAQTARLNVPFGTLAGAPRAPAPNPHTLHTRARSGPR